jgi:glutamyl-tRNA reductase
MTISVLGINHKTADLTLRGKFAFTPEEMTEALNDFCEKNQASQALILSTCNRTEIYSDSPLPPLKNWISWLLEFKNKEPIFPSSEIIQKFYAYQDIEALDHGIRVASSLDSLVMGEPQILGQLKKAYQYTHQAGCIGEELSLFFNIIIRTAKKIRHETPIGRCPVSMAYCSLHALGLEKFKKAKILILGAGETAKKILHHVLQAGASHITVLNRTPEKAEALIHKFRHLYPLVHFEFHPLSEVGISKAMGGVNSDLDLDFNPGLNPLISGSEIIISTVQLPQNSKALVDLNLLQKIWGNIPNAKHTQSKLFFIDLSSPRTIDKNITALPFTELLDIDEIQSFIEKNIGHRTQASTQAEEIIQAGILFFKKKKLEQQATPSVLIIRENIEHLIQSELQKALREISQGKSAELTLKKLAHRLKQKWLHHPSKTLHSAASQGEEKLHELLKITHSLFDL